MRWYEFCREIIHHVCNIRFLDSLMFVSLWIGALNFKQKGGVDQLRFSEVWWLYATGRRGRDPHIMVTTDYGPFGAVGL